MKQGRPTGIYQSKRKKIICGNLGLKLLYYAIIKIINYIHTEKTIRKRSCLLVNNERLTFCYYMHLPFCLINFLTLNFSYFR